ncbi:radical SAM additional 4Fe4S-binding SPASM domain-containing protein [Methanolobus vulcani]|uniref:Radical SAM additional 4Fe4S-binding SPASM domain-containing protein n=1 Tax=Methanolobus vulcani TaxID=38026 RepID=A0A7Z7FDB0_9EURY|nr:PqqD family peptide modification chaperone [Methanolobus vulcani]SDG14139.1 radical SAM additional 4Fe4S-binding SPASM domain-containing protein [Methanolobus vulcani]
MIEKQSGTLTADAYNIDAGMAFGSGLPDRSAVPYFPFRIRKEDDIWITEDPLSSEIQELNEAAYWLLKMCDGYRTLDEITAQLSTSFHSDRDTVMEKSKPVLDELTYRGLLWWRNERMNYWKVPAPAGVLWDLTSKCNLRCRHCVVSAGEECSDELSFDDCCRLIDEFADFEVGQLILSGGEPMIRKDFFDIAEYAASKNIMIQVATNGTLIDEDAAEKLANIGARAQVSLDSSVPEIHDDFRQSSGSWEKTVKGIKLLVKAGVPVTLAAAVTTMNIDNIPETYELGKELGVQTFRILPFVPSGRGTGAFDLEVKPARMRKLTEFLLSKRESDGPEIAPMEFECTFRPIPEHEIEIDTDIRIGCDGAIGYCTVTSRGDVLPCNYFEGADVENVKDRSFRWIWDNSRFLNYFRSLKASDMKGECSRCQWLPVCRGSCIAANFTRRDIFQANCHCWLVNDK